MSAYASALALYRWDRLVARCAHPWGLVLAFAELMGDAVGGFWRAEADRLARWADTIFASWKSEKDARIAARADVVRLERICKEAGIDPR